MKKPTRKPGRFTLLGDKTFDSNRFVQDLDQRGAKAVFSQHTGRAHNLKIEAEMCKWRPLIENFCCKVREFKRPTKRACKTDHSFSAMIYLAAAVINSRGVPTSLKIIAQSGASGLSAPTCCQRNNPREPDNTNGYPDLAVSPTASGPLAVCANW